MSSEDPLKKGEQPKIELAEGEKMSEVSAETIPAPVENRAETLKSEIGSYEQGIATREKNAGKTNDDLDRLRGDLDISTDQPEAPSQIASAESIKTQQREMDARLKELNTLTPEMARNNPEFQRLAKEGSKEFLDKTGAEKLGAEHQDALFGRTGDPSYPTIEQNTLEKFKKNNPEEAFKTLDDEKIKVYEKLSEDPIYRKLEREALEQANRNLQNTKHTAEDSDRAHTFAQIRANEKFVRSYEEKANGYAERWEKFLTENPKARGMRLWDVYDLPGAEKMNIPEIEIGQIAKVVEQIKKEKTEAKERHARDEREKIAKKEEKNRKEKAEAQKRLDEEKLEKEKANAEISSGEKPPEDSEELKATALRAEGKAKAQESTKKEAVIVGEQPKSEAFKAEKEESSGTDNTGAEKTEKTSENLPDLEAETATEEGEKASEEGEPESETLSEERGTGEEDGKEEATNAEAAETEQRAREDQESADEEKNQAEKERAQEKLKEKMEALALEMQKKAEATLGKLGIKMSRYGQSGAWALDAIERERGERDPNSTDADESLKITMEKQQEAINKQVGWELFKQRSAKKEILNNVKNEEKQKKMKEFLEREPKEEDTLSVKELKEMGKLAREI